MHVFLSHESLSLSLSFLNFFSLFSYLPPVKNLSSLYILPHLGLCLNTDMEQNIFVQVWENYCL